MLKGSKYIQQRFIENISRAPKLKLSKKNSFLVFPFELTLGAINSTEDGIRDIDNVNVDDYSSFQRVFTGLENVLAQWEDAYSVVKNNATHLTKEYKVGRSFQGYVVDETLSTTFETSNVANDFLMELTEENFIIHTYEDITQKDLFKFYIIPELKEFKWLYVSSATKYYLPNKKLHHVELTLTTLNNKIAKSGRAVEEFIHRSAPGEGYAFPVVSEDQVVSLDDIRKRDIPITSMQVEIGGPAGIGMLCAYGRPTIQQKVNGITSSTFNPKIEAPRLLLPLGMETPIPSPLNTRPNAETDYYVGRFKPTLEENFDNWKQQIVANYDISQRANFQGVLEATDTLENIRLTNPLNQGSHQYTMWDPIWSPAVDKTLDTKTNALTGDSIVLKKDYKINEILSHNIFGLSHISTLPLSIKQNISWSLTDIPLVGGFLSKMTFGVPIGWRDTAIRISIDDVLIIQPTSLVEYGNVLQGRKPDEIATKPQIDLLTYTGQNQDTAIEVSGINSTGTIFKIALTHLFKKTIANVEYTFDTKDLGQTIPTDDATGKTLVPGSYNPTDKLLWDETCKPTDRGDTPGYVIDASKFQALAKSNYRLSFFSNDIETWQGTYQTNSQFTGHIRDWTNYIKMSNWKEDNDNVIDYPAAIVAPKPPNVQQPIFNFDFQVNNFQSAYYTDLLTDFSISGGGTKALKYFVYEPPNAGRSGYIKTKDDIEYTSETIIATLDTLPYGGMNNFKNNYETLFMQIEEKHKWSNDIIFWGRSGGTQLLGINIPGLITSGSKEMQVWQRDDNEQRWIDDKDVFQTGLLMTNTKHSKVYLKLRVNGNVIEVISKSVYKTTIKQFLNIDSKAWSNAPREHDGSIITDTWTIPLWIKAIPKTI